MTERREYTRVRCTAESVLQLPDGATLQGVTRDLSLGGAHMDCAEAPAAAPPGGGAPACTLMLSIPGRDATLPVALRCDLVYLEGGRAGLRFTGAEAADFERFRDFLLALADDPQALEQEMRHYPNPVFARGPALPAWVRRLWRRESPPPSP